MTLPTRIEPAFTHGPDADDPLLVELLEGVLVGVGDVAGDLLGPELRLADLDGELLDVDGAECVGLRRPSRR